VILSTTKKKKKRKEKKRRNNWGMVLVAGERRWGKGEGGEDGANTVYTCVNGKMRPAETIPGKGDRGEWWRGKFKYI
jgi:hypothetical protein